MRQNREFLVPLTCPAVGDASVGRKKGWNRFGATGMFPVKSASGKFWSFSPLSRIFREKIPSIPDGRIRSSGAGKNRTVCEGFGDGLVPGWDTLRGLSRPEFNPEKIPGERGGFILKNTTTATPRGMENPISPSTLWRRHLSAAQTSSDPHCRPLIPCF